MKKSNFISRFRSAIATALQYWYAHSLIFKAMENIYIKEWQDELMNCRLSITIRIIPCGSIYYVAQSFYCDGSYLKDVSWLATYSWHGGGCLVSIGPMHDLIFDPLQKLLYLEEWGVGEITVDKYKQI